MRVELKGEGLPIPSLALPHDNDEVLVPPLALFLENGAFLKAPYVAQGYTRYEIWCIGAAGGKGGGYDTIFGGAGGGGGLHRVEGELANLPDSSPVIRGVVGADGRNQNDKPTMAGGGGNYVPNPAFLPSLAGQDGGTSSFNGNLCRASGGKGGAPSPTVGYYDTEANAWRNFQPGGDGGDGGLGGRTAAGGGGQGGKTTAQYNRYPYTFPSDYIHAQAVDGVWDTELIGSGGGGGRGGNTMTNDTYWVETYHEAGSGAKGSYSFVDTSVWGPGAQRESFFVRASPSSPAFTAWVIPGGGGGARINTVNNYGSMAPTYSPNGAVFIRLT